MSSSHYSSDVMHIKSLSPHLFTTYVCMPCFPPFNKTFLTFIHVSHAAGVHLFLFLDSIALHEDILICSLSCDGCLSCFHFFLNNTIVLLWTYWSMSPYAHGQEFLWRGA